MHVSLVVICIVGKKSGMGISCKGIIGYGSIL